MSLFRSLKSRMRSLRRKRVKMADFADDSAVDYSENGQECEGAYSLEEKFRACVEIIQNLPKKGPVPTTYVEMLTMYALFKQATEGPCRTAQPGFWNVVERYKWDAWHRLGEMDKEEAMETYVAGTLEKIDYCADQWDWDEMLSKHATDYDKLEPILRKNFQIIEREYIKSDGTRVQRASSTGGRPTGVLSFNPNRSKTRDQRQPTGEDWTQRVQEEEAAAHVNQAPIDPLSDAEYCDARDGNSLSRSSSLGSLNDRHHSPQGRRVRSLKAYCARMDVELRAINAALTALSAATDARHQSIIKMIKNSAVYIAVPSRLSWRSLFFFLVWPFIVHWAIKYFGGQAAIDRLY